MAKLNLDSREVRPMKICLIGGGGFIGSHLCEKLMVDTPHHAIVVDVYYYKISPLLEKSCPWKDRIEFHMMNIKLRKNRSTSLEALIAKSDVTINLAAICTPADYNTRPIETMYSNFHDAIPVIDFCAKRKKRLIHFSSCEVYGKTIASFLPKDHPLRQDPEFYCLKEYDTPCVFGSIEKQRWSYACAKQMTERLLFALGTQQGLNFTIVRPFNWIGPRMDYIRGVDGPSFGVPRVLACFSGNLMRGQPLKLVDGGQSRRTFCFVKDAIEAVLLMIENPERANRRIFNVGNPENEVTVKQLAEMMIEVYAEVSGKSASDMSTVDVRSRDFYGDGYDDCDRRVPDMTIINRQLGWNPETPLKELLKITLAYQHQRYSEAIKREFSAQTS